MPDKVIKVYKKSGQTPLDCINTLKKEDPELRFLPMTYAGRLDPLAEGVLILLVGDECLRKEEYLKLSKEYEVDVLFGFSTDTYDVMGKVIESTTPLEPLLEKSKIQKILPNFIGKIKQSYPPYSSRTVKGKPLFEWAREGKLDEIEIPSRNVFVENIEIIDNSFIRGEDLLLNIREKVSLVNGDFRQKEILAKWDNELREKKDEKYFCAKLRISCGSGVYVRGIANDIGKELGVGALALKIVRTEVGEYSI